MRKLNLEVLNRGSIQAITFPSAHVASTMAAALVLVWFVPLAGAIFLAIAVSIAIGAFLGRYHYFLDVAAGRDRGVDRFFGLRVDAAALDPACLCTRAASGIWRKGHGPPAADLRRAVPLLVPLLDC